MAGSGPAAPQRATEGGASSSGLQRRACRNGCGTCVLQHALDSHAPWHAGAMGRESSRVRGLA
eukprot:8361982-Lingulodinium_polyedra.AAC.1